METCDLEATNVETEPLQSPTQHKANTSESNNPLAPQRTRARDQQAEKRNTRELGDEPTTTTTNAKTNRRRRTTNNKNIDNKGGSPNTDSPLATIRPPNTTLKCLLINARSMKKHKYEIRDTIENHTPDLTFITETWLNDHDEAPTLHEAIPPGYRTVTANRSTHAGGLAVIYKASYTVTLQETDTQESFEHLILKVNVDKKISQSFLLIYRPPKKKICVFHAELADLITSIYNKHPNLTILGDFNNKFNWINDPNTKKLTAFMSSLGLQQIVQGKTQRYGNTLDAIFTDSSTTSITGTYPLYWTDHWFIDFNIRIPNTRHSGKTPTANTESTRAWNKLLNNPAVTAWLLNHLPAQDILNNPTTGPESMDKCLREAVQTFAPEKQRKVRNNRRAGWHSPAIKALKTEHRALERTWLKDENEENRLMLIKQRRRLNYMTKTKKKEHYTGRILNSKNPSKELFKILSEFRHPEALTPPEHKSQDFGNELSEHFFTKVQKYRKGIIERNQTTDRTNSHSANCEEQTGPKAETPKEKQSMNSLKELNPDDFHKLVKDSKKSGSPEDPCPARVMRELLLTIPPLREAVRTMINCSLREGVVADIRKKTLVKPLLKKKSLDPKKPDHYRPVSNNSYFAKLEERAVFLQLSAHVEANNWLDDHQVGFRKNRSTESATTAIWEDLKLMADKNEASVLILLDLSAAFDTVDHTILIERLSSYGLEGTALKWIASFLNNRTQSIWTPPHKSQEKGVPCGVPQGASISPLLFNLYLRPLLELIRSHGITAYNYADDIQLLARYADPRSNTSPDVQGVMEAIDKWMTKNFLVLNPDKTVIMATGNNHFLPKTMPWPTSMGTPPPTSEECINLGIKMDFKLLLKKHCVKLAKSCNFHIKQLRKILPFLAFPQKVTAAAAFVLSRLDFGNSILLGTSKENLHLLQRTQNMAARLVLNLQPRDHISPALFNLHWLPIGRRISFKALCITHRALYNPSTEFIAKRFRKTINNRPRRNGPGPTLEVPRFNKWNMGGSSFTRTCSKIWNLLPGHIRSTENHLKFRKLLKTWLFPTEMEGKQGTAATRIAYLPNTIERKDRSQSAAQQQTPEDTA